MQWLQSIFLIMSMLDILSVIYKMKIMFYFAYYKKIKSEILIFLEGNLLGNIYSHRKH